MEKLENQTIYELPNGATLMVMSFDDGTDGVIYTPRAKNVPIHIYSPETEKGHAASVYFYDLLSVCIDGYRKSKPRLFLEGDEWPCTLEVDYENSKNIKFVHLRDGETE